MSKNLVNFLTPTQAAQTLGISPRRVLALCKTGRLGAKYGGRYLITRAELDAFKNLPRKAGNPNWKKSDID